RGGEFAVQRGRGAQVDRAFFERVTERLGGRAEHRGARPQERHELGRFFEQRRPEGERVGGLFERRGPPPGRVVQRARDARPRGEERVLVGEQRGVLVGDGRVLRGHAV